MTKHYLEDPLSLSAVAAELGAHPKDLQAQFRSPTFAALGLEPLTTEKGLVRRDMWEDYFDQVVDQLGLGVPIVPLDGLTRPDFQPSPNVQPHQLAVEVATNHKGNVFRPGDAMVLTVTNKSNRDVYVELIYSAANGRKRSCRCPATGSRRTGRVSTRRRARPWRSGTNRARIRSRSSRPSRSFRPANCCAPTRVRVGPGIIWRIGSCIGFTT